METVIRDLKEKNLLSEQAAANLSASFSGSALELIKRCMNKGQYSKAVYPAELRAFALALQFYSARAYDYVRKTFNNCLSTPSENCQNLQMRRDSIYIENLLLKTTNVSRFKLGIIHF